MLIYKTFSWKEAILLLGEMPKSQANTFNHPAAILYLKGKETPYKQLFMNNIFMPAHAQACPRITAADYTTKQSGLAHHPHSRTPAGPRTRTPAEGPGSPG